MGAPAHTKVTIQAQRERGNDSPPYSSQLNYTYATRTHLDDFSNSAAFLVLSFAVWLLPAAAVDSDSEVRQTKRHRYIGDVCGIH